MAINEYMMELLEEMVDPAEIALNEQIEEDLEAEADALSLSDDLEEEIILKIASGERFAYENAIDFSEL